MQRDATQSGSLTGASLRSRRSAVVRGLASWVLVSWVLAMMIGCREDRPPQERTTRPAIQPIQPPHASVGQPLAPEDIQGLFRQTGARAILAQVFAESCGPCLTEAIELNDLQQALLQKGVLVIGLGMDEQPTGVHTFLQQTGGRIVFPLYWAPWFAEQQKVDQTPALFLLRPDGTVKKIDRPESPDDPGRVPIGKLLEEALSRLQHVGKTRPVALDDRSAGGPEPSGGADALQRLFKLTNLHVFAEA